MAEYINREALMAELADRQAFLVKEWGFRDHHTRGFTEAVDTIIQCPAADVVEVVRCKDCKRWDRHTRINLDYGACYRYGMSMRFDDFCSYGERRNDG